MHAEIEGKATFILVSFAATKPKPRLHRKLLIIGLLLFTILFIYYVKIFQYENQLSYESWFKFKHIDEKKTKYVISD